MSGDMLINKRIESLPISLCRSAEWGMRVLQGSFLQLNNCIINLKTWFEDMADHEVFLHPIPIIYNFRTKFVGLNQSKSIIYFTELAQKVS
jgi:hypothetical protein